jgi:hypothetical protein
MRATTKYDRNSIAAEQRPKHVRRGKVDILAARGRAVRPVLSARYIADHCGSALRTGRKPFGRIEMAKAPERMQRRHVREKATIDHLVQDVYKPKPPDERHAPHSPTTSTGLPVEDQVHKEWDPRKGGLPTF